MKSIIIVVLIVLLSVALVSTKRTRGFDRVKLLADASKEQCESICGNVFPSKFTKCGQYCAAGKFDTTRCKNLLQTNKWLCQVVNNKINEAAVDSISMLSDSANDCGENQDWVWDLYPILGRCACKPGYVRSSKYFGRCRKL
jgi:uncharacterized Rmd1/YagE family protein